MKFTRKQIAINISQFVAACLFAYLGHPYVGIAVAMVHID